jgi:hypothetical protein
MSFIKHGDGKILDVVDSEELTAEQKKAVKKVSKEFVKQSDESTDSSVQKRSGS